MIAINEHSPNRPPRRRSRQESRSVSGHRDRWLLAICLIGIVYFGYGPTRKFELLQYGDRPRLEQPFFSPPTVEHLNWLWRPACHRTFRPVADSLLWVETLLARQPSSKGVQLDASLFHVVNFTLHALTALLAFSLLRYAFGHQLAAFGGAAFFALHPLQVESVASLSGQSVLVAGFFSLAALRLFLGAVEAGQRPKERKSEKVQPADSFDGGMFTSWRFLLATVCLIAAMLSNTMAAAVPLMALVLAICIEKLAWREALWSTAPWLLLALVLGLCVGNSSPVATAERMPLWTRPLVATDAVTFYAGKLFLPFGFAPDYGRSPLVAAEGSWFYLAWLVPAVLVGALLFVRAALPWWGAMGLFAAALVPSFGLIAFARQDASTVADRYAYLAVLGPALLITYALARNWRWLELVSISTFLVVAVVLLRFQIAPWSNDQSLIDWGLDMNPNSYVLYTASARRLQADGDAEQALERLKESVAHNPDLPQPHVMLGEALRRSGEFKAAEAEFHAALMAVPAWPPAQNGLGRVLLDQNQPEKATAYFRDALRADAQDPLARRNLGEALRMEGQWDEAREAYQAALRRAPFDALAQSGLALVELNQEHPTAAADWCRRAIGNAPYNDVVHFRLAIVLRAQGKATEALKEFLAAVKLAPKNVQAHVEAGKMLVERDQLAEAAPHFWAALEVEPFHAEAYYELGRILQKQHRIDQAIAHYRAAVRIDDRFVAAHAGLASALADHGEWAESVRYYNSAVMLAPKDAQLRNNLGFVLIQIGLLPEAVKCFEHALKIIPDFRQARENLEATRRELARRKAASQASSTRSAESGKPAPVE